MKVLLINLHSAGSRSGYSGLFFPFGMAYISAVLRKLGFFISCLDLHTKQIFDESADSWKAINEFGLSTYDIVAFGGVFMEFKELKLLSEKIFLKNKDIFQIAGGNMASLIADVLLRETQVKVVCLYEGEETIIELLTNMQAGNNWKMIPGIKYLNEIGLITQTSPRNKIDNLDTIPFPDRENWSFNIIRKAFPYGSPGRYCAVVFASRGCPFSCTFCNPLSGKKIRTRSAENIIEEIKYLKSRWNIGYVRFFDEVFIGSKEKIKELCGLMLKNKLNIFWWCQTQIQLVDEQILRLMKEAGCLEVGYGVESGSNTILLEMKKGITREQSREVIEMTDRVGIKPSLNIIAGTPSETQETLIETRDFLISLNHIEWAEIPQISYVIPLPNTELFNTAKAKGMIVDEKKYITEEMFNLGRYSKTINLTRMIDKDFYGSIKQCNQKIKNDFYFKHPLRKYLSILGLDHLRMDYLFTNFSFSQLRPVSEVMLWAMVGKRNNIVGNFMSRFIYNN